MKKTVKYLSLVLIFLLSANMLCACTQKPWNYKDSTWYSEEPNISIYWHETKWCGKLKSSDDTIEIVLVWGSAMGFNIFEKNADTTKQSNYLMYGVIKNYNSKIFVVEILGNKIYNNQYKTLTFYRE